MPRLMGLLLAAFLVCPAPLRAQDQHLVRISLENAPNHVQARAVLSFAQELERLSKGRLRVETYCDGTLFRDRDVIRMLELGRVEMAVPGTWQITPFEPSFDVFMLPLFQRRSSQDHLRAVDGNLGRLLGQRLEEKASVVVLGRWLALGHAHLFGVRRVIQGQADLAGLRVRTPGGRVSALCLREQGAQVVSIPWPDLRACLQADKVDAVLTTYETIASGRLWECGIVSAFESAQYFAMFTPLVSRSFWESLPEDLRELTRSVWERSVDAQRVAAADSQAEAAALFQKRGGAVRTPSLQEDQAVQARLARQAADMAARAGVAGEIVEAARAALAGPPARQAAPADPTAAATGARQE